MQRSYLWAGVVSTALLISAGEGWAETYDFTSIAKSGPGSGFLTVDFPALNNSGFVAFQATDFALLGGYQRGSGGALTPIFAVDANFAGSFSQPSINDAGTVAFLTGVEGGASKVVQVGDGTASAAAIATDFQPSPFTLVRTPSINNSGAVAFGGASLGPAFPAGENIFVHSGGTTASLYHTGPDFLTLNLGDPFINASGDVAFRANDSNGIEGIFKGNGGTATPIASASGPFGSLFLGSMNDAGVVIFNGTLDASGEGIFFGSGGQVTTVADTSGPFSDFDFSPSIATGNRVAFLATLDAGGTGIFTGPDPVADKVVATGDVLAGKSITGLGFFREGLNDSGSVAFRATFADGTKGIFRADPQRIVVPPVVPLPSALLLFPGAAMAGLACYWRMKRVNEPAIQ